MDIAISFAGLVKHTAGKFKSEKQRVFLTSQCDSDKRYSTSGVVWGNTFTLTYAVDSIGVTSVTRYTKGKGDVITWTRPEPGSMSVQAEKEVRRLKKLLKSTKAIITNQQEAFDVGGYDGMLDIFHSSMKEAASTVETILGMIAKLTEV